VTLLFLLLSSVVLVVAPLIPWTWSQWSCAAVRIGTERVGWTASKHPAAAPAEVILCEGKLAGEKNSQQGKRQQWSEVLHGVRSFLKDYVPTIGGLANASTVALRFWQ
jgi:hypothetical protein